MTRNSNSMRLPFVALIIFASVFTTFASAQNSARSSRRSPANRGPQVEAAFKPAFYCKPAVNRIDARKGQTIPFEFRMEPVRENVRVSVRPVALRQFETGAIRADLESPAPAEIILDSKTEYDLQLGEEMILSGKIRLPKNDSDFHSFGILVQDNGYLDDNPTRDGQVTYGVKFVSQYILRCDVTVTNGRGTDINKLEIETAELAEYNGVPSAQVMVFNPTDSTIEFELESNLSREGYAETKKGIKLFAPINSSDNPPQKYITRIFPKTRLRMVSGWPNAIFPGEFAFETRVMRKRKTIFVATTPLMIGPDDFPAQATFASQVSPGIHVHPAQLFLSRQRGAKRFVPVHLTNLSNRKVTLDLAPVDDRGEVIKWLSVRPQQISIAPGAKRKSMLSVTSRADNESHRLAYLNIVELDEEGRYDKQCNLPVAFQGSDPFSPILATNAMRLDTDVEGGAFVVDVMNQSPLPIPISATIKYRSATGNNQTAETGYGKWLLPSSQRRLEFRIESSIPEGELPIELTFADAKSNQIAKREFVLNIEKPVGNDPQLPGSPGTIPDPKVAASSANPNSPSGE
ncbi:hypothetical protein [Mariniblastus fucicola]|uniref:Large cysteine-rich periplasmic protein OmcB n=1 Tax=Mariniblastus fucicola TaxID=980251 RepID=A0A5B9PEJ6_9BACT|nr:hypothetical protein [Mariniblastus fucicola]QEG21461.1 hypothetical protein MFFC18_13170 [Mariniblastus fucicola]